ncbi:response regulator [Geobacter sp. DSM 9736]|uniref:response regulator n=1 Tax=Geobacter sp. DSM 9736 TaxID=1277350 RepID=UPI000B50B050|nr:response regulator [Geobacter sp. DSM 9736]SNB44891.1 Response regulator receiver domain-containing protein [Geobacter sp. DSM 9736]
MKSRGKILLIDDDQAFLGLLSAAFTDSGFSVVTAGDGVAGIKAFVQEHPQVVIADLVMPRLGGVSTCMEIARLAGADEPVIILLTSMFHEPPHEHQIPEMGAKFHLSKRTKPVDIVIIVEQLLDRNRSSAGY